MSDKELQERIAAALERHNNKALAAAWRGDPSLMHEVRKAIAEELRDTAECFDNDDESIEVALSGVDYVINVINNRASQWEGEG